MELIGVMAAVTMFTRFAGLGLARWLAAWRPAEQALANAGPSLMGTYLLIQVAQAPALAPPVLATMAVAWRSGGLQVSLLSGWVVLMAVRHL